MASVTLNENDRESDDDDHVYDHLPPPPLVRQASSHADSRCEYCSICQERVMCLFGHLRMGCQCVFHYTCLLAYIRSKDRNSWLKNKGVSCPNSGLVNSCKASNYVIDFTELETLLALFENQTYENREIMFPNPLSAAEVLKYRSWIVPDEQCDRQMLEGEDDDEG